ncbi:NACHT, LRR and PYD domains-containing protein 3-like [Sphaeramia orbicularis]|uniref:NACHT, LRR and PYD domains-containing protein 3-like n=1 Tax=Sphaeramia orbicularis TaxID=375764 RepID=UPI00117D1EE7|nr:NACHT, LRR and PYD domains-containing protein 3-like [Sphaeramia orbicularis]
MVTPVELLDTLEDLTEGDFKKFKWFLQQAEILEGFPAVPKSQLENADRLDTVDQILDTYQDHAVEVIIKVLKKINKNDLVKRLTNVNSASKEMLAICQRKLKLTLRKKLQHLLKPANKSGKQLFMNGLYTELDITEEKSEDVKNKQKSTQTGNAMDDFLKPSQDVLVRTLMTKGEVGSGKTVLTQKMVLDWTEDKVGDNIQFVFPFTFQELSLLKDKKYSWVELLHYFFTDTKELGICSFDELQILFIFDGLDECQLPLDFHNNEILNDVSESATVDVLLTNLIMGKLLPSARLWITTTPEGVDQIPHQYIHKVTEVRGFTDSKKDEYFRKRYRNKELASRVISHIKASRSLRIRCHNPVFCWISATVLEDALQSTERAKLPKTLTEMYTHFLVVLSKLANVKHDGRTQTTSLLNAETSTMIMSLGKLAFKHLLKGKRIFSEADLIECDIDMNLVPTYSGLFIQMFSEENRLCQGKLYSFVHSSVQEFLAAVHVVASFINSGVNLLSEEQLNSQPSPVTMDGCEVKNIHQSAVHIALQSPNGHLDLFLRFIIGLSLQTNETLLKELLKLSGRSLESTHETVQHIKACLRKSPSPERCISLFHCLNELNEPSVVDEVQQYLTTSTKQPSPAQWSALVFVLLTSQSNLGVFDLKKYSISEEGLFRLMPVVEASHQCLLTGCKLSDRVWATLATAFSSPFSNLRVLDLSDTNMLCGIRYLSAGLKNPQCRLETLRLSGCSVTNINCEDLSSALSSESSSLRELDLSNNDMTHGGMKDLSKGLRSPHCRLETLRLISCFLTWGYCDAVAFFLSSQYSSLKKLDLSLNNLGDSGVRVFCTGLKSPHCKLETLRLSICNLTEESCEILASVLSSDSSSLKVLDLSNNNLQDSGVKHLLTAIEHPKCKLDSLRLGDCKLSEGSCEDFGSALSSQTCHLRELELNNNDLRDSGVRLLCAGLKSPHCRLETLGLSGCMVTEDGCTSLNSVLSANPSHLRELDLSYNHPGGTGLTVLSAGLDDPLWALTTLRVDHGGVNRIKPDVRKYACKLELDPNTAHRQLLLFNDNTQVEYVKTPQPYPYHPERFIECSQVMCTTGLTGRCYWEVEYKERTGIALTYQGISRRGDSKMCRFGENDKSWKFCCSRSSGLSVCHNNNETDVRSDMKETNRVGVYLDWPAGTVSLYRVCSDTLTHLHTICTTFTEPLYPGFKVNDTGARVSLCQ